MYPSLPSSQHQTLYTEPNLKPEVFLAWGSKVVKISGSIDHNQDQTTPTWSPRAPLKDPWSGLSLSSFPRPHIKIKQMIIPHQWITPKTQKDLDDGPDGTHSSQVHNHRGRPWVYHRIYGPDLASGSTWAPQSNLNVNEYETIQFCTVLMVFELHPTPLVLVYKNTEVYRNDVAEWFAKRNKGGRKMVADLGYCNSKTKFNEINRTIP